MTTENLLLAIYPIFLTLLLWVFSFQKFFSYKVRWDLVALLIYLLASFLLLRGMHFFGKSILLFNATAAILLFNLVGQFYRRNRLLVERCNGQMETISQSIKNIDKDTDFYSARAKQLELQIQGRKELSAFTKEMGRILDPELVKKRLLEKIESLFHGERISFSASGLENDAVTQWVSERKIAVLIKDVAADPRFSSFRNSPQLVGNGSVLAVPLIVGKSLFGIIRIDSKTPQRFMETDLQQLELYANIAALALENSQLYRRLHAMATQDELTGLATHKKFQERLTEEILRAARYRFSLSLAILDIDHFKMVNDRFGHLVGDDVLRKVSEILKKKCREVDFAARYGGEEFAVLLPQTGLEQSFEFAEQIRKTIAQQTIFAFGQNLQITISAGCSAFPQDAQIPSQLIRCADERLYKAKMLGRNQVIWK